jgi:hypothetical protein
LKKNTITTFLIFLLLMVFQPLSNLSAQEEVQEVKNLTTIVEKKLSKVKQSDVVNYAQEEINIIEGYVKETKRLIKEEKYQRAYYVISIAVSYFSLINAKSSLNESKAALNRIKEKLNE